MPRLCLKCIISLLNIILSKQISGQNVEQSNSCEYEGMKIKPGESMSVSGKCYQVKCDYVFPAPHVLASSCALFIPSSGCHKSEIDYSKPFPECCPYEICG